MNRRGFLGAILEAGVAPAVVKASSLMPLWLPRANPYEVIVTVGGGNTLLTIEMITREALRILHKNMAFMESLNSSFYDEFKTADRVAIRSLNNVFSLE